MIETTSNYFEIDGAKIHYEAIGEGDPLLLVHAGFFDSRMWDEQFAFFARSYRVIRFDMRGFGKSDPVQGPVIRRQEIYQLMKHLEIEQAALAGCSLGGGNIIDFALEHPTMVTALIVVSAVPGGFEMQGEPPAMLLEMFAALEQNDLERATDLQIRLFIDGPFRKPDQVDPIVRQRAAEMNGLPAKNGTFFKADAQPIHPLDPPAVGRLKEIQAPALITVGALDDPEIYRAAGFMENEFPFARKVVIPDAAHLHNMEQPVLFNQAVSEFLSQVKTSKSL